MDEVALARPKIAIELAVVAEVVEGGRRGRREFMEIRVS